jgi:hypothetical protein
MPFYRVQAYTHFHQHCALVSATGTDFQDPLAGLGVEELGLESNSERLRNGLATGYRKRLVLVGVFEEGRVQKNMPRDSFYSIQHTFIDYPFFPKFLHQFSP